MGLLAYLLCSAGLLAIREVPAGTRLEIRLTTAVGSYASKTNAPVSAVLIAPVMAGNDILLPAGAVLTGRVKSVRRVGLGFIHETAAIDLEFSEVALPNAERIPISARVTGVDNGRERVEKDGNITGTRSTGSMSYRTSGYIRYVLGLNVHAQLMAWAIKTLVVQVPESEIYYPAGVELALTLTEALPVKAASEVASEGFNAPRHLTEPELSELDTLTAEVPIRTSAPSNNRPADVVNVLLVGSREDISAAFRAAGWVDTPRSTLGSRLKALRAVGEARGFADAPMTALLLNDVEADMSWQKGLNDVSKRHHVRVWKEAGTLDGREIWAGAATRDIDFAYARRGQTFTHRIATNVDEERDKVAYDLAFTSCADVLDWTERTGIPRQMRNATGDPMTTDARVAVVGVGNCAVPRISTESSDWNALPVHGRIFQRFVRREILSLRSDLIRNNPYWRGYEGVCLLVSTLRKRNQTPEAADVAPTMRLTRFVALR